MFRWPPASSCSRPCDNAAANPHPESPAAQSSAQLMTAAIALLHLELKRQMQRHLQEPRTAQRVLNDTELPGRRARISSLEADAGCLRKARVAPGAHVVRRIAEEWIKPNVVVGRVEASMVEHVKGLHIEAQGKPFGELEGLEDGHIDARLERAAEDVAACRAETRLVDVARARGRVTWWNTVLTRSEEGHAERVPIEHRISCVYTERTLQPRICGRGTNPTHRNNRIGALVLPTAVKEAGSTTREIDDAVRLTALGNHKPAESPAVYGVPGLALQVASLGQCELENACEDVR